VESGGHGSEDWRGAEDRIHRTRARLRIGPEKRTLVMTEPIPFQAAPCATSPILLLNSRPRTEFWRRACSFGASLALARGRSDTKRIPPESAWHRSIRSQRKSREQQFRRSNPGATMMADGEDPSLGEDLAPAEAHSADAVLKRNHQFSSTSRESERLGHRDKKQEPARESLQDSRSFDSKG
jgi:hypothetical protein